MSQYSELKFDSILPDLKVTGHKQVIKSLSAHVEKLIGTPANEMTALLSSEEAKQSAVVRGGVSILDAKLPRLTKPLIIFTRSVNPVDFMAADNMPVDLICLVLSPTHEGPRHLRRLAKVSHFFNDTHFCELLRHAEDNSDIKSILIETNKQRIAA